MRTPVLDISGPADQPAVQGIPAGFCFRDGAAVTRCSNPNAMMTQTARSRNRKSALRRTCALGLGLSCFFIESSLASGAPIVIGEPRECRDLFALFVSEGMGDKRATTSLCDVISGAERRVTNSAALWVRCVRITRRLLEKIAAVASIRASWRVSIGVNTAEIFEIRPGRVDDVRVILQLIRDLATYERAPDEVSATEEQLIEVLFGERPTAEVLLALEGETPVGFAVYFYNFSTWLGRAGLYLEDLFVKPEKRGKGYGRVLLVELAKIARD